MAALNVFKKKEDKKSTNKKASSSDSSSSEEAKSKKTKPTSSKKGSKAKITSGAHRLIVKPLISEKSTYLGGENKYVFEVATNANKKEIKQAIKDVYGVDPEKVNIMNVKGKSRRYGKTTGRTKDRKKAVVTLPEGSSIQVYEGV